MRGRPAVPDEEQHAGQVEELEGGDHEASPFPPEVIDAACQNFAMSVELARNQVDEALINSRSPSLGIAGWSDTKLVVLGYGEIR